MPVFRRLDGATIRKEFTHVGLYAGIVPIYMRIDPDVDYDSGEAPLYLSERNWIPNGSVNLVKTLWNILNIFWRNNPPVYVTGEIVDPNEL